MTGALRPRIAGLSARARRRGTPAPPIISPPLPAPLPESDLRHAERIFAPRPGRAWRPDETDPWAPVATEAPDSHLGSDATDTGGRLGRGPTGSATLVLSGVFAPSARGALEDLCDVDLLVPGTPRPPRATSDRDLFVVDRAALFTGVWAGTETARGTSLLHELLARIEAARHRGVHTVLIESANAPNVGTNLVRDAVQHVVPSAGSGASAWSPSVRPGLTATHRQLVDALRASTQPRPTEVARDDP